MNLSGYTVLAGQGGYYSLLCTACNQCVTLPDPFGSTLAGMTTAASRHYWAEHRP